MDIDYYKILNVNKNSTTNDIKKAYYKLALIYHPDKKTGDAIKFKEISEAYEILSNEDKREKYDSGFIFKNNNINPFDIFNDILNNSTIFNFDNNYINVLNEMNNGINGFHNYNENIFDISDISNIFKNNPLSDILNNKFKKNNKIVKIDVTLDELYYGTKKKITINTKNKCNNCNGIGYNIEDKLECSNCDNGFNLHNDIKIPCNICKTNGYIIKDNKYCSICNGNCYNITKSKYNLKINRGSIDGKEILLKNKGDYIVEDNYVNDLIIKLNQIPHNIYTRKNNELYVNINIDFVDLLCMDFYKLKYLNNEYIYIQTDNILNANNNYIIKDKGMPIIIDNKILFGDLIVKFTINYPEIYNNDIKEKIKKVFNYKSNIDNKELTNNIIYTFN